MNYVLNLKWLVGVFALVTLTLTLALVQNQPKTTDYVAIKSENMRLSQQVAFLKEQLNIYNDNSASIINKFTSNISFKLVSCIGDKSSQRVTVTYRCQSKNIAHQRIQFCTNKFGNTESVGYDDFGKSYKVIEASLGNAERRYGSQETTLPTDVPLIGTVTLYNVLVSNVDALRQVRIYFETQNNDGGQNEQKGFVEFSNVKINWR